MANFVFKGVIPPISTIFNEKLQFDPAGQGRLIDFLIDSGVDGMFFLFFCGEFTQMSAAERKEVAAAAVAHVKGRVPVLIGTGSTNTREAIELSVHAKEVGADGIVVINPYYWHLTEANLRQYFVSIAQSVAPLPVMLYNFPALTGQDLTPDFVASLVKECPNIVGIKETLDCIGHISEMNRVVHQVNPDFAVFCGFDNHLLTNLLSGGAGVISASGNFVPKFTINTYQSFIKGDLAAACKWHQHLLQVIRAYGLDSPFVNCVKEASVLCGVDIPTYVLPPTSPLSAEKKAQLKALLQELGII